MTTTFDPTALDAPFDRAARLLTGRRPVTPLRLAQQLARTPDLVSLLPLPGSERRWLKLATDAGWDAWLIGWPPGARTGWHDHQGSAGAFVLIDGTLSEWSVPLSDAVSRSGDTGAVNADERDVRHRSFTRGDGRQFADHHIHEMGNETNSVAYSVHAYAPELSAMAAYSWVSGRLTWSRLETSADW
ncbi:MAG: hypothetical protein QOF57_1852 [Frankiaceae bacterium]|nr:hypothetical protein [Frankiaceae bacterium]